MSKHIERRPLTRPISKRIAVIYHANCADGFGAAWAAWKKFGARAEYFPAHHGVPPPPGLQEKEIYFIDFTYPKKITEKLIKENKRVTAIDHHISAIEIVKLTKDFSFDLNRSGAILAWHYFHPHKRPPRLLKHIEDMDLWKFKLSATKEIFSFLDLFDFNFKVWDKLIREIENPEIFKKYRHQGKLLLRYEDKLIERLVHSNAERVRFEGYETFIVNFPFFESQIANILLKKLPPIGIVWRKKMGKIGVSIRSNGSVDVSKIAAKFGGGGHKRAAGFTLDPARPLPWKYLEK